MKKILNCLYLLLLMRTAHAQEVVANDIVINEILFNAEKNGFDYIECFNRSIKPIPLNFILISNGKTTRQITKDSLSVSPGSFFLLVADKQWLTTRYTIPASAVICQVSSLPSFPDDEGSVVVMRRSDSMEIDKLMYSSKWHFEMIPEQEGVALERISADFASQNKNNWTSASASSGYGTPGQTNSQFRDKTSSTEGVSVLPKIFTPDNDGNNDFAQVNIRSSQPGSVANAIVYNSTGRPVKYLIKNEVLGADNRFIWDGYDDRSNKLPTGIYIIAIQVFDIQGNVKRFRNCIVVSNLKS